MVGYVCSSKGIIVAVLFLILSFSSISCGKKINKSQVNKIFGSEEFIPVDEDLGNIPEKFKNFVNAIGRMNPQCTASHVGDGIVVTAGHCVGASLSLRKNVKCETVSIEWGVKKSNVAQFVSKCESILAMQVNDLVDYAILKVNDFPDQRFDVSLTKYPDETAITVFGYPGGQSLQWSKYCKITDQGRASFASLGFSHQCDTQVGSSGGPVALSESGVLIAIHNGGDSKNNYATNLADIGLQEFLTGAAGLGGTQ